VSRSHTESGTRRAALDALRDAGREHSDATVFWHTTIANRVGIHPTDYKTMSLLQRRGPMTAGAIAEATGLASGSVTALIDRLRKRGCARRVHDPDDRRRVLVEATPQAIEMFAPYFSSPELSQDRLYEPYSVEQLKTILDFLDRSAERLRRATARVTGENTHAPALEREST
jgi:DNA-binding MarR family transcriptional regulator